MFKKIFKKASGAIGIVAITVLIMLILFYIYGSSNVECKKNSDCGSAQYCGSDFECHDFPNIEKKVYEVNLLIPAIVLGVAIVIAAYMLKKH